MVVKAHNENLKDALRTNYDLAKITAWFVGLTFNGKKIPDFKEVSPDVEKDTKHHQEQDEEAIDEIARKQFMMMKTVINLQRKHNK